MIWEIVTDSRMIPITWWDTTPHIGTFMEAHAEAHLALVYILTDKI